VENRIGQRACRKSDNNGSRPSAVVRTPASRTKRAGPREESEISDTTRRIFHPRRQTAIKRSARSADSRREYESDDYRALVDRSMDREPRIPRDWRIDDLPIRDQIPISDSISPTSSDSQSSVRYSRSELFVITFHPRNARSRVGGCSGCSRFPEDIPI